MKRKVTCILMLMLILVVQLGVGIMSRPSLADGEKDNRNENLVAGMGQALSSKGTGAEGLVSGDDGSLRNIFERKPALPNGEKRWDFNITSGWSDMAYANGNETRLIVGSNTSLASLSELEKVASRDQGKIVNVVSMGGEVKAAVVEIPEIAVASFVEEVKGIRLVSYIEPSMKVQVQLAPNDPYWSLQWGPQKIGADWAWNTTTGGSSVTVAVVDTGIDYTHPDLLANYVPLGYDWVNNDSDPKDDYGHGTHCAGIIAAELNNSIGVAGMAQIKIMAEKVVGSDGYGLVEWVANGIAHAVDQGARIISLSLGLDTDSELLHDAVKYAYNAGALVIASAGNDNTNMKSYPAAYDEVVAVAATDQSDGKAWFSNFGDWIELGAPGVDIYSTMPTYYVTLNSEGYSMNYDYMSGTSMACPHVSGVAALIWSRYPNKTRDWIRSWLRYTADDLGDPGFDIFYGYGRVNARKAIEQTPPAHELIAYEWKTPPYVEPGTLGIVNATVLNFGENDETDMTVQLIANDTIVDSVSPGSLASRNSTVVNLVWNPTVEGLYNVTFYALPVLGETNVENNALSKSIYVGFPRKAFVLHSAGNIRDEAIASWQALNEEWNQFGTNMIYIDYTTLNKEDITYADITATGADVLIISCAYDRYAGWEFTDSEIEAIQQYVHEGHGLIATAGTLYDGAPNNNKLAPLFGLNETTMWTSTGIDLLHLVNASHPIFTSIPDPLVFPQVANAVPYDGKWDSNELVNGKYLALGHYKEGAIVTYRGLVYISPWLEIIPPYYQHHLQLLYNAIEWSQYQKPQHELVVSLEAPTHLQPGESVLLNATVSNKGLNNETNIEFGLLMDGSPVNFTVISELPVGASYDVEYSWTPFVQKTYNVTAYSPPLPGEEYTSNNVATRIVSVRPITHVLFDQTHSTDWIYSYSEWVASLNESGYIIDTHTDGPITSVVLNNYDVFIIPQACYSYSPDELLAIQNFVFDGGGLLVIGDDYPSIYTDLTGFAGITWTYGGVSGITTHITPHPVTTGVASIDFLGPIAFMNVADVAQGLVKDSAQNVMLAVSEQQCGKVIGFADEDTLMNYGIQQADNLRLADNMVDWLSIPIRLEHELATSLNAPPFLAPNIQSLLNATVHNRGLSNETNVELELLISGSVVQSEVLSELLSGASHTLSYSWTPLTEGEYNVTAYSVPVENETSSANNAATKLVKVTQPLIRPQEGQYAHYALFSVNSTTGKKIPVGIWNFTYSTYISPYQILVQMDEKIGDYAWSSWVIVNIFTRAVEQSSDGSWTGIWYPGWIETNVTLGSAVDLLYNDATITGSRLILVGDRPIHCWEIQFYYYGYLYKFWYDKASGLWTATQLSGGSFDYMVLAGTNIPIGLVFQHDLAVMLDAPLSMQLGENTTLNATVYNIGLNDETNVMLEIAINDTLVSNASISMLCAGQRYALSYQWTPSNTGQMNVTAYVLPTIGEGCTTDNIAVATVGVFYYTRLHAPHQWVEGGVPTGWYADDACWQYNLAFDFPFYGINYRTIYISSNGLITFNNPDSSCDNSIDALATRMAIAPAWDDWVIWEPYDIYIWENSTCIGIRWQVRHYSSDTTANFEAILNSQGVIQFNYEQNDGAVSSTAGISNGAGHILAEDLDDLNYTQTTVFLPYPRILIPGDIDGDGSVGLGDLVMLALSYGSRLGDPNWNQYADIAPPWGIIDLADLVTLAIHYGQTFHP